MTYLNSVKTMKTESGTLIPVDPSVKIWKYFDIWKFISLLESNKLHFTRADIIKKNEPLDGKYPNKIHDLLKIEHEDSADIWWKLPNVMDGILFINCWNISSQENAALWKIYTQNSQGISIQSTYGKLIDSIDNKHLISGLVNYIDHNTLEFENGNTLKSTGNAFYHCFLKHVSYSYERELRLVYQSYDKEYIEHVTKKTNNRTENYGFDRRKFIKISINDLNRLIEKIYASPFLEPWKIEIINILLSKFNLNKRIIKSELS